MESRIKVNLFVDNSNGEQDFEEYTVKLAFMPSKGEYLYFDGDKYLVISREVYLEDSLVYCNENTKSRYNLFIKKEATL